MEWFRDTPWTSVPAYMEGELVLAGPVRPQPRLLGGSSKLARLAEERRKKAGASQSTENAPAAPVNSLDRLSKPKNTKENVSPQPPSEPKKYPTRKKREATPPPRIPTPEPEESKEELPDLRATPSNFGSTLATRPASSSEAKALALSDLLASTSVEDPFKGPSPDDAVMRAQSTSKGINK